MIILRCIYIYIYIYRERETVFPTQYFMHASYTHSYCQQKCSKPCKGETVGSPSHMLQPWRPINRGTISKSECCSWKPPPKKKHECPSRSTQKKHTWLSIGFPKIFLLQSGCWVKAIEEDCEIVGSLDILLDAPGEVCARDTPFWWFFWLLLWKQAK